MRSALVAPTVAELTRTVALAAYTEGYAAGADLRCTRASRGVPGWQDVHRHWDAGFDAGRAAAEQAQRAYADALADAEAGRG